MTYLYEKNDALLLRRWVIHNSIPFAIFAYPIFIFSILVYEELAIMYSGSGVMAFIGGMYQLPPFPRGELVALPVGLSVGLVMGCILGYPQWRILRDAVGMSRRWIWGSSVSWAISVGLLYPLIIWLWRSTISITLLLFILLVVFSTSQSLFSGIGQYRLLKSKFFNAHRWIAAQFIGWSIGIMILFSETIFLIGPYSIIHIGILGLLGYFVWAVITGFALIRVMTSRSEIRFHRAHLTPLRYL